MATKKNDGIMLAWLCESSIQPTPKLAAMMTEL
jgi:hypothetical protein